MISKSFSIAMGVDLKKFNLALPFQTVGRGIEESMGMTYFLTFPLNHGKVDEKRCSITVAVVDTNAYCVLLSMEFIAGVGGMVDSWGENFHYRFEDAAGVV